MVSLQPTFMQSGLRAFSVLWLKLFARITVTGQENIPPDGPLIIVANHLSTMDPILLMAVLPLGVRYVGPGDFKLLFPGNLFVAWGRVIRVRRTLQFERAPLTEMTAWLKAGGRLALFPEGGTWEKSILDAKAGAAYLSLTAGAPVLPIGLGNTYRSWYKVGRLQRPRLTVNIGQVMPAFKVVDRSQRAEALEAATHTMMQRIYELLPPETQALYDDWARRQYDLAVDVWRGERRERVTLPGQAVIAEVMLKPNLISPLAKNARLAIDPFCHPGLRFVSASVRLAVKELETAFSGPFSDYMPYRLGEVKTRDLYAGLAALGQLASLPDISGITLLPTSFVR